MLQLRKVLKNLLMILLLLDLSNICGFHEAGHDVDGYREDYGAVVFSGYAVQSLKISKLDMLN